MNVALYARVSTRDKGQDTENQIAPMRAWATAAGHTVVAVYQDTVSSSGKVKRPEFEAMMKLANEPECRRWSMLVFWSLDRLSREGVLETLQILKNLNDAGVCWRSHTEAYLDSCGVFKDAVLAILAAVAKQERIRISERVKAGLENARTQGHFGGRPRRHWPAETVDAVRYARGIGLTLNEIAAQHGLSRSAVHRISQTQL